ncbi:MAG: response regulator [Verrucomicrobia bacterium]|nr:response regulator [Verrucomicrobiota bacterium]
MPTILLADDDDALANVIHKILTRAKHQVFRARNGAEALQLYDTHAVDLVLTDLIMPDMDGLELIQKLRHAAPALKIIAMSGGGRNTPGSYLPVAQHLGAACTLAKPFSGADLLAAIETVLGKT